MGNCAGALSCSVSGEPPATLTEYTLGSRPRPVAHRWVQHAARGASRAAPWTSRRGASPSSVSQVVKFEHVCPLTSYSMFFKGLCPDAYSYAKDDQNSTFTYPVDTNYYVDFCPPTSGMTAGDDNGRRVGGGRVWCGAGRGGGWRRQSARYVLDEMLSGNPCPLLLEEKSPPSEVLDECSTKAQFARQDCAADAGAAQFVPELMLT
ncbi:Os06g0296500 [Oryza sativa Japonica Group]|uniref:Os06g0296500 protein n=1 Tax=Oryza sativa subsp. japonica TaxID=39947 RepID=C7J3B3_ORYSJ|nr:Os06g0296500 [Oryza sativa Japonica Group]|eukprot:NP_001174733.1 Os06g0296500 [Oryza sativa Japonica Group]